MVYNGRNMNEKKITSITFSFALHNWMHKQ